MEIDIPAVQEPEDIILNQYLPTPGQQGREVLVCRCVGARTRARNGMHVVRCRGAMHRNTDQWPGGRREEHSAEDGPARVVALSHPGLPPAPRRV
jgi:hypothetical protein